MTTTAVAAARPAKGRERDLWAALYQEYAAELTGYCRRYMVRNHTQDDAEDMVADAFAEAARHLHTLEGLVPNQRRAWLYRAVRCNMTDHWRRTQLKAHARISLDRQYDSMLDGQPLNHHGDDDGSIGSSLADERATDPESSAMVDALLADLRACCTDARDRLLLHACLTGAEGADFKELAEMLGVSLSAVKMRLMRLRRLWAVAVVRFDPALLGYMQAPYRAQVPALCAEADAKHARDAAWQAQRAAPGGKTAAKKIRLIDRKRQAAQTLARAS